MAADNPTPEQAHAFLMQTVYIPVYMEKLATAFNIVPQSEAEAQHLVNIGFKLEAARAQELTKQASQQGNFIALADQHLDRQMGQLGYNAPAPAEEALIKQASARLSQDASFQMATNIYTQALQGKMAE